MVGLVVVAAAAGIWFLASHEAPLPIQSELSTAQLVLPTKPSEIAADQLRQEAEQIVGDLIERFPESASAHRTAAILYQFLNQYERVITHWEKCVALNATDASAREWLAKAQLKQGEDAAAIQTLERARQAGLNTAEICHQYALAMQRKGDLADSELFAQQSLLLYPQHLDLWIALGHAQLQQGKLAEANRSFDAALKIDSKSTSAHFAAANVCLRLGDDQAAAAHRSEVEKSQAVGRRDQLPFDEGYELSLRNIAASVLSLAAAVYHENGSREEALRLCLRACAIQPASPEPYRQLANIYVREGNLKFALQVQQRLSEIEPANDANHLNLSSLLFQMGRSDEGEAVLKSAAQASPDRAIFPESLAIVYCRTGRFDTARPWAETCVRLEPSVERYRLLADICQQVGDEPAALAALQAATQWAASDTPRGRKE